MVRCRELSHCDYIVAERPTGFIVYVVTKITIMKQAFVSAVVVLALTVDANAQLQSAEDTFFPSIFLRQAVVNYLPTDTDPESQVDGSGSNDLLDLVNESPEYLEFDHSLPPNFGLNMQASAYPTTPTNFSVMIPMLQQGASQGMSAEEAEQAAIAEALANPLSYLWLMFMQNDTLGYTGNILDTLGEDDVINNTLLIQPVLSIQLTEKWKTVIRPVIPINSFETVGNVDLTTGGVSPPFGVNLKRESGIGDIVLWMALSNQYKPPNIWGFGITTMFDTASEDQLGTGKNSAGPMVMGIKVTEKWIVGFVAQHWWSFSGQDTLTINTSLGPVLVDRPDVSLTDVQAIVRYRVNAETNIGMAPNWRYNHETNQLSLPIGIGADTLIKIGPLPVKIGLEAYYFVESDSDFGPEWQFRLLFVPVLPAPGWAKNPLF